MDDLLEAEIWSIIRTDQGNAVLLRPSGLDCSVPIFVGQLEAHAILMGFRDTPFIRPLTHDLMINLLNKLSVKLLRLEIHELKDNTFYGRLVFNGKDFPAGPPIVMDCRPSDGLSLAIRSGCSVLISESVVREAGIPLSMFTEPEEAAGNSGAAEDPASGEASDRAAGELDGEPQFIPTTEYENVSEKTLDYRKYIKQSKLKAELDRLVAAEEYEQAAKLRDIISLLDKEEDDD